jgi:hypothetical protein
MLFFLGCCFFLLSWALTDIKIQPGTPKSIAFLYIIGLVLLDMAILAGLVLVWGAEHGKW